MFYIIYQKQENKSGIKWESLDKFITDLKCHIYIQKKILELIQAITTYEKQGLWKQELMY